MNILMETLTSLILVAILSAISSQVIVQDVNEPIIEEDFLTVATKKKLKIYYHEQKTPSEFIHVDVTDAKALLNTSYTVNLPTYIIFHGWNDTPEGEMCTSISDTLSKNRSVNILAVDWRAVAKLPYNESFAEVGDLGHLCATWVWTLEYDKRVVVADISLIGHSMGAHIAGVLGYTLGSHCDHAIGLDPSGELFNINDTSNRITPGSAQFVQIIHTSTLGLYDPMGHADYYPNGGKEQKGCSSDDNGTCSSARSYKYYVESMETGLFEAMKCNSYYDYEAGTCNGNTSWLGGYEIDKSAYYGKYYVDTNPESPFAKSQR